MSYFLENVMYFDRDFRIRHLRNKLRRIRWRDARWIVSHEHTLRLLLHNAVLTPRIFLDAVKTLDYCLRRLRWHQNYGKWLEIVRNALVACMEVGNIRYKSLLYVRLGELHLVDGDHRSAFHAATLALSNIAEDDEIIELEAWILLFRTQTLRSYRDIQANQIGRAIRLAKHYKDFAELRAMLYQQLGLYFGYRNQFRTSEGFSRLAFRLWRRYGNTQGRVDCLVISAFSARWQGNFNRFERIARVVEGVIQPELNLLQYALFVHERGAVALNRDAFADAIKYFGKAVDHFTTVKSQRLLAMGYQSLGLAYIETGDYTSASNALYIAKRMWSSNSSEDVFGCVDIRVAKAYLESRRGQLPRAMMLLAQASKYLDKIADPNQKVLLSSAIAYRSEKIIQLWNQQLPPKL